jgi:hypothetical protein
MPIEGAALRRTLKMDRSAPPCAARVRARGRCLLASPETNPQDPLEMHAFPRQCSHRAAPAARWGQHRACGTSERERVEPHFFGKALARPGCGAASLVRSDKYLAAPTRAASRD